MNREDIVKVEVLLNEDASVKELDAAYREFFKGKRPPLRTLKTVVFPGEEGVQVKMNAYAHQAPTSCQQPNIKYDVNETVWIDSGVSSHAIRIGSRIYTAAVAGTVPVTRQVYDASKPPVINGPASTSEMQQAFQNVEQITARGGATRTKWVWLAAYSSVPANFFTYLNFLSSFFNGTTTYPCPKTDYYSTIGVSDATFAVEVVAYANVNGAQFNPSIVNFADLSAAEEQETEGEVSIPQITACIDTTNPACPNISDFRGTVTQSELLPKTHYR